MPLPAYETTLLIWGLADSDFQMLLQEFQFNAVEERVIAGDTQSLDGVDPDVYSTRGSARGSSPWRLAVSRLCRWMFEDPVLAFGAE